MPPTVILSGATTSQSFDGKGASYPAPRTATGDASNPLLADSDQMKLRYDSATNTYEIQLPATSAWLKIAGVDGGTWATADHSVSLVSRPGSNTALLTWSAPNSFGTTAVAIPTPASAMPTSGSGHYSGSLAGFSTERIGLNSPFDPPQVMARVTGTISLDFNFATGTLAGHIVPRVGPRFTYAVAPLNFSQTVFAVGSTTFSGKFDTPLPGLNSFSGMFAGPSANEVAGNFAFPYISPINHQAVHQASGAFTATKGP